MRVHNIALAPGFDALAYICSDTIGRTPARPFPVSRPPPITKTPCMYFLSLQDRHFDSIVGALEEAVMDPTFANLQQSFVDEWCGKKVRVHPPDAPPSRNTALQSNSTTVKALVASSTQRRLLVT